MAKKDKTRMYCHPEFKKMIDLRRIEYGDTDSVLFTKKVAANPEMLKGVFNAPEPKENEIVKKFKRPSLF